MSTLVTYQPCSTSSQANFVAWASAISTYLGAMYAATVTVSGSGLTVTATSWSVGSAFPTDGSWNGATILIGGVQYPVSSVTSGSVLTLSSPANNGAGQTFTAGWIQTGDVGQVVWTATAWTGTTLTAVGSVVTATWTSYTGPLPRVGMTVTFSGFSNSGNNAIFTLTAVNIAAHTMTFTNAAVNLPDANNGSGAGTTVAIGGTLTGTCNTSGTGVTWVSGNYFPTGGLTTGTISIGGTNYTISSIGSPTFLSTTGTITTGGGAGVTFSFTYAYPSATNTYSIECWGLADALQSTSPFYVKIYYGTGGTSSDPVLYVAAGTQPTYFINFPVNGQLSGALSLCNSMGNTNVGSNTSVGNSATSYEMDLSGNVDRFGCILWRNSTGSLSRIWAVDRSKNGTGGNTGNYLTLVTAGTGQYSTQQSVFATSVATLGWGTTTQEGGSSQYRWVTVMPITSTTGQVNGNTMVSPVYPTVGYIDYPHLMAVCGFGVDWAEGSSPTPTILGSAHTYLFTKSTGIISLANQGNNTSVSVFPAIRWE